MLFKYININDLEYLQKEVLHYLPSICFKGTGFRAYHPSKFSKCIRLQNCIQTFTSQDNVTKIAVSTVLGKMNNIWPIHIDYDKEFPNFFPYALIIPILNCNLDQSYTGFYKSENNDEEIGKMILTKAAFFNTQIPHRAVNYTELTRITISIRFKECFNF